jgi:hypothetical protein
LAALAGGRTAAVADDPGTAALTASLPAASAATPVPTVTATPVATATPVPSPAATATPEPTPAETATPEPTPAATPVTEATPATPPVATATPAATASPVATPTPTPRANATQGAGELFHCTVEDIISTSTSGCGSSSAKPRNVASTKAEQPDATATAPVTGSGGGLAAPVLGGGEGEPFAVGVPSFFINRFRIPPFLLPIYQAAGIEYGVRWEVLAAINEIETDYGRNLNVSSAGALGWMQFMAATWETYGVDANHDGAKDPMNPVDAIFAAARYLRAAGADTDLRRAIFAYNHADWYVDSVLMRARVISGLPGDLVGSLTGLTQGRFPVAARARYAETDGARIARAAAGDTTRRRAIRIVAKAGSKVVAANDGRVVRIGRSHRLGRYVTLQDAYGNLYTYGHLGSVATTHPVAREHERTKGAGRAEAEARRDPAPKRAASTTGKAARRAAERAGDTAAAGAAVAKERLFANPSRAAAHKAGGDLQLADGTLGIVAAPGVQLDPRDYVIRRMKAGSRILAGTVLGRIGRPKRGHVPSHMRFELRPAGAGAPRIDPRPILDGWRLLDASALYRTTEAAGADDDAPTIGQLLLMSKEQLQQRVLGDPRISIYPCGRADIRAGLIDRRVLATLEFLAANGLSPTVSALECGHGYRTSSGNVSEHSTGSAVDIAAINGTPIAGHQGKGSVTDATIQKLLQLQGTMKPHQIISLMRYAGTDNTLSMADHDDHIHVGFRPAYGENRAAARKVAEILSPKQWDDLSDRLADIVNPDVRAQPSDYAISTTAEPAGP